MRTASPFAHAAVVTALALALVLGVPSSGSAQDPEAPRQQPAGDGASPEDPERTAAGTGESEATSTEAGANQDDDAEDDQSFDRAEPDFTVINLPTTLRLPRYKSAFRLTHRFTRPLGQGDFGNLLEDFFGFDGGALIGLEFRFGVARGAQLGIYRTSDRTIQFFGQYDVLRQTETRPVGVAALVAIEGTNNFRDVYSPSLGVVVSHAFGRRGALYAQPIWVHNSNPLPSELTEEDNTLMLGLGARVNVVGSLYGVAEWAPRLAGYDPGRDLVSFGVEGHVGGHGFQLNFSNSLGTTRAQVARGGLDNEDWYIGFNISRKFW